MSSFVYCVIMFIVCFILSVLFETYIDEKPELKFFLFWMAVCIVLYFIFTFAAAFYAFMAYMFVFATDADEYAGSGGGSGSSCTSKKERMYDKIYDDGTRRTENLSKTGYYYSDGKESWKGMLGEEHISDGKIIYDNSCGRRDIYKNGEYVGYEYDDIAGVTHRVEK